MSAKSHNMILGQLITNEVLDTRILQALNEVPRETFLPPNLQGAAYVDDDMHIGNGRFLISPLTFARLLQLAEITPHCRVLNIGCLTGYTTAILAKLAGHVVATDIDPTLISQSQTNLDGLGISDVNFQYVHSLTEGYALSAPYDAIVISGAVDYIPDALATQLSLNGRLVAVRRVSKRPGISGGLGKGIVIRRIATQLHYREMYDDATPLLPGFEHAQGFVF